MTWEQAVDWLRRQPGRSELVQACFYDDPLLEAARRYHASSEWLALGEWLPGVPGKALDLGAGRGIASYALARDGWQVTALEPDTSTLVGAGAIRRLAAEANLNICIEQQWGEQLPFADATFDLVHARAVLHHAQDLAQLCREAARVLKPGGMLVATREHVISSIKDKPEFLAQHPLHHLYGGENAYLLREYTRALQQAGIRPVAVLNPFESDINLYPQTRDTIRQLVAGKLHIPARWIPDWALTLLGRMSHAPGRLYTFVGVKL